jgi:arsenical pump membrane protein
VFGFVAPEEAVKAVGQGTDVYLFLAGMMLLAEVARREGVFEWVAAHAVRASRGSRLRLFSLVYGVGIIVTVVLSNDATAVVLTPAVAAAVRRTRVKPLPYLFACAFVANAASFVLPISNPANLVVFANAVPPLGRWLLWFGLPSLFSIVVTYVLLMLLSWRDFHGDGMETVALPVLGLGGRVVLCAIGVMVGVLLIASTFGAPLGAITCACGVGTLLIACIGDREAFIGTMRSVSWTFLLLVAGLFVLVRGWEATGLLGITEHAVGKMIEWPPALSLLGAAGLSAAGSNLANNLPMGLLAGASVASLHGHDALRSAVAVGIDLGPNLSVTGSLATMLWLIELRREKIDVSAWRFLRVGALVMPPALILAVESILLTIR